MRWEVQSASGTVSELHERSLALISGSAAEPFGHRRLAVVQNPVDSAVVLGSSQLESSVDLDACARAGIDVVRRRSGGGAVLVEPGSVVWVDLFIAAIDPLWSADVGRSTWWVGEAWADALRSNGLGPLEVWKGAMVRNAWSSWVCFAGLGPGEVVVVPGRKVVGISQRRTSHAALFQCACVVRWEPERLLELLAWPIEQLGAARRELAGAATGIGAERAELVVGDLLTALP
jgi:lipoate---protein ligase